MNLKSISKRIKRLLIVLLCLSITLLLWSQHKLSQSHEQRYLSYIAADELRQSSDDMTRMVRSYTVTNNPDFEKMFWEILAIRNGELPRPERYENIYWDYRAYDNTKPRPDGEAIALQEIMKNLGFTDMDFSKLAEAQRNSEELVKIEEIALHAMKGVFPDEHGEFTITGKPDFEFARSILFDKSYHLAKVGIMAPIDDFFIQINKRTEKTVETYTLLTILSIIMVFLTVFFLLLTMEIDFRGQKKVQSIQVDQLRAGNEVLEQRVLERTGEIQQLSSYLSNIINSMPSVLVGVDSDLNITLWNNEAEKITGVDPEKAKGTPFFQHFPYMNCIKEKIEDAINSRDIQRESKTKLNREDKTIYENITIYPLERKGSREAIIRFDDITEYVLLEETVAQSEKMLSVGGLAAGMAHEINNPLGGMIQMSQVILKRLTDNDLSANRSSAEYAGTSMEAINAYLKRRKIPDMFHQIIDSGQRASSIVHNMLSFAKMDNSGPSLYDIPGLIDKCIDLCYMDFNILKKYDFKKIEIIRQYQEGLPPVPCESGKIQQVIMNILRNGAEAMSASAGASRFSISVFHNRKLEMVQIEIKDNGPGMPEHVRKRIFEPFFTTKSVDNGTGLGLSVSYFIITENHKGLFSVESEEGIGTTFIIQLPL